MRYFFWQTRSTGRFLRKDLRGFILTEEPRQSRRVLWWGFCTKTAIQFGRWNGDRGMGVKSVLSAFLWRGCFSVEVSVWPNGFGTFSASDRKGRSNGKGAWRDNVFVERLWRHIKYEEVYLSAYESMKEARTRIDKWIDYYSCKHQTLKTKQNCLDALDLFTVLCNLR